jgi:hypothetical protein
MRKIRAILAGVFLTVVAIWMGVSWYPKYAIGVASNSWPETSGHVKSTDSDFVSGKHSYFRGWVEYEYKLANGMHTGDVEVISDEEKTKVEETLKQFPQGKTVTVYYDPQHTDTSVITRGDGAATAIQFLGIAGMAGVAGIAMLLCAFFWR